ncbi:iron ABC transporter permease [Lysinibacillus telephonicus]|uniref:ABC transporter permease n=1 Tax=Lysinibacillus telephonicus TaxID=1714840 RepID=UPI0031FDD8A8
MLKLTKKPSAPTVLGWGVVFILILFILLPLAAVLIQIVLPGIFFGKLDFQGFGLVFEIFERKLWSKSLSNSLLLGAGTAVLGTVIGTALAIMRKSRSFYTAILLDFTAWALLILPSFIIAQGWVLFSNGNGIANHILGLPWVNDFVFQPMGLIFIMSLCKFPYAYLAVTAALEWNVSYFNDAARLNGATSWRALRTIQIPLVIPALLSGAALIFMDTIGDFGLPASLAAVYSFPTLSYSIYTALYTAPIRYDMAGILSFYLVAIIVFVMLFQLWILRKGNYSTISGRAIRTNPLKTKNSWLYDFINIGFLLIALGIPIGSSIIVSFMDSIGGGITISNFTLENYQELLNIDSTILEGLKNSLTIAALAGVIGLIVGIGIGYVLIFTDFKYRSFIDTLSVVSLAVPGVVLGIGYIFIWNQPFLEHIHLHLYGTPAILVLASVAGAIPIAARLMISSMTKIPASLLASASIQGASLTRRIFTILLPLMRASLLTAGLTAFGTSIFDLAITSILYPPNFVTLPVAINKAFEDLNYGFATAATITSGTIIIIFMMTFKWFVEKGIDYFLNLAKKEKSHVFKDSKRVKEI